MNPIYTSPFISFIDTSTKKPIIHPEGDYSQLNLKLERLESLIEKYQPQQPIVFFYKPPSERRIHYSPSHTFTSPAIGSSPQVTTFTKIENFNDFQTHLIQLNNLINNVTARVENEYDEHPLHYKKRVEFRGASYIDNRQAFSFIPVGKPFGDYPLTKQFFDKSIENLNSIKNDYKISVDFVTDWEEQYSSFDGPPKSYGIEITVFLKDIQLPTIKTFMNKEELQLCKDNHDFLDENLAPMFENLSINIGQWYDSTKNLESKLAVLTLKRF